MENIKKIISIIILIILLPILFVNVTILFNSFIYPDEIPSFLGWKPFIVLSGSMEPTIYPGDLVIVKEVKSENIKEGDIIAFREDDIVITHRVEKIIKEEGTKYITKGDNNNTEDNGDVLPEQIEGLYQFRISRLGNLAIFIQTPLGMIICLSIPLVLLLLIQLFDSIELKKYQKEKMREEKVLKEEIEDLKKQNEELLKK